MSRIGKKPVIIPAGVEIKIEKNVISVKGPKGQLEQSINTSNIKAEIADGAVTFKALSEDKDTLAYWGLYRALVANLIKGVTEGFKKDLELVGVGYRANMKGSNLVLNVGYSHPVEITPPSGIILNAEENTKISVSGIDKQLVGLTAAKIRDIRKPEPYKGKGIKYKGEVVRRKAGKTGGK